MIDGCKPLPGIPYLERFSQSRFACKGLFIRSGDSAGLRKTPVFSKRRGSWNFILSGSITIGSLFYICIGFIKTATSMLKDILSIAGYSGLYKYLKKSRNGIIVENLDTGKRMNADATARINSLEDISIYTEQGDMELKDVLKAIHEQEDGQKTINPKKASGQELKEYFAQVIPEYDRDRVYTSDMKKILTWYNTLQRLEMIDLSEEAEQEEQSAEDQEAGDQQKPSDNDS